MLCQRVGFYLLIEEAYHLSEDCDIGIDSIKDRVRH